MNIKRKIAKPIVEAIDKEADLILKLSPISENEIFDFMKNLKGGTYFNMGMYSSIPVARAWKASYRIYKVIEMSAIVSGIEYENKKDVKQYRDETGKDKVGSWYDHLAGFENKVGVKKSDPNCKYVLWDIKPNSGTNVKYYLVDLDTDKVIPITKEDMLTSEYLTDSEKKKLTPTPVSGINLNTGELVVYDKINWRTAAFEHIFWLNQNGASTREFGNRFEEDLALQEEFGNYADIFVDGHPYVKTDLDAILAGNIDEALFTEFPESE